ncbi:MAG TPA: multidrug effflux MFS transporter [Sphingomicrobium sp.]|nr:multidrug effflux MFS transporter [Sphingomicrobium sp.]
MFESMTHDGVKRLGTREMTALLAGLMALNSFAIDGMIPALPAIGRSLHVLDANARQLVVIAYFLGFASTQLVWGPLADRFGRKSVLGAGIALFTLFALLCALSHSFALLIASRFAMGASAAVTRVLVIAMVRDLFEREAMARVMSLVFMVFMLMPVLAPNIGIAILWIGPWQAIFGALAAYGLLMLLWAWARLPETLHPEYRRSLRLGDMAAAVWQTIREPLSRGYTIAMTISFSALVAYIASIQQIVFDAFHEPRLIGLVFAGIAAPMAVASWANSRVVGRFGLRRVGHSASAAFMLIALVHLAIALSGHETLLVFVILQALTMCAFAFTSSNFGTLAMEHMAAIAGTASSVQGMLGTVGAALIGFVIGRAFDGTVLPYLVGTAGCATGGFIGVVLTEPKNLFARLQQEQSQLAIPSIPEEVV